MKRTISALYLLLATFFVMFAQQETPITWGASVRMTSENQGIVYIRATIEPGWHLYSTTIPKGGPKPTSFSFESSKGVKFSEPVKAKSKVIEKLDPQFGINLSFYEESALFTRTFTIDPGVNNAEINVTVSFMGCNDQTCLPPNKAVLSVPQSKFRKSKK